MARIPDHQLNRLKQEISVERLAEGRGVVLKRHGADLIGLCPFHDDKEPSLVITPKTNLWHCLGKCQAGGSVIDWVMKAEAVSFRHAVELLMADAVQGCSNVAGGRKPGATYQPLVAGSKSATKRTTVQKLPTALDSEFDDARLLSQVIDYYHATLKQSPEAQAYLQKRGISAEAVDYFKLGFANRTLGYRLPAKNRKEGSAIRGQLQRIGLYRASGHEHFSGSIVFPVIDENNQITEVYGRKINDNLRKGTPKHLYLPGPHAGIWNGRALSVSKEIILCESLIDALSFWCAGFRNVTCSYGIEGFTADHLNAFKTYKTERILIAYDRDDAGEKASTTLATKLNKAGIDAYRIQFPKNMDANEYALQVMPANKSLGVVIRAAQWLGKGKAKKTKSVSSEVVGVEPLPEIVPETELVQAEKEDSPLPSLVADEVKPDEVKSDVVPVENPLPAAAVPQAPSSTVEAEIKDNEIIITLGDRRYRLRGLDKNPSLASLKINLLVSRSAFEGVGEAIHVDSFDLYQSRPRTAFIKQASVELGVKDDVIKADLGKLLLKCEALQTEMLEAAQTNKNKTVTLDEEESHAAMELLQSPDLLKRIQNDFTRCGVVGEEVNKLVGYLATISRKLENPLAITIQSTSAAGKSAMMDAVLAFIPEEERIKYSAMTGQSLFYMGETNLQHKVLAIVEEEGASNASYALKLLQSEGELTIASTGKDPESGELKTQDYQVKGPVMIMLTTTAIDIDEELLNRCIVLTVDEGRKQTQAIHEIQRNKRSLSGLLAKTDKQSILTLHQNAQRLLKPLAVVNPYSDALTFIDDRTRTRRDHEKYLTLIDSIALLHQHQRTVKNIAYEGKTLSYVEVTLDDIETANRLAHEVLGRSLDELPPQTRKLLTHIKKLVKDECKTQAMDQKDVRFSRRTVRDVSRYGNTQLKIHLNRLEDLEYLLIHRGGRGQSFEYELLYDGHNEGDQLYLSGLINVRELRQKQVYDEKKSGQNGRLSGSSRGQVAPKSGGSRGAKNTPKSSHSKPLPEPDDELLKKALLPAQSKTTHHSGMLAEANE